MKRGFLFTFYLPNAQRFHYELEKKSCTFKMLAVSSGADMKKEMKTELKSLTVVRVNLG